ncbi:CP family cyanate transporter-like MFS transporter [Cytobacillus eiseniae]|uniref:CP family cyanate transporter-like MFS transporter n=1 Tax=Cytobacillus eiseniae TaxID=762947 RepID=A0ABS4RAZ7_9BACI|nr:MFS transporter [Cytobacillus eiseniae]MBP2239505.1 CP family cyanate transporter-like MFS transporter [Cytobacillus eiseniae]
MNITNQDRINQDGNSYPRVQKSAAIWLFIVGIIFIATNLRSPLTSVGPLVGFIRDQLHISNTLAGMITTLPLLAFAFFSPIVPILGRKFGVERIILVSIIVLTFGIILRSLAGVTSLYIGTAIIGIAISICNVLLPSLIKREFPKRIGLMTGVYSISMNVFGAIASGISVPIAIGLGFGWQGALGIWGILSFISILFWLPQMKRHKEHEASVQNQTATSTVNIWRSSLAWQVSLFMGLQSMVFYVLIAWLPEILMQKGLSTDQSGWLLSIMQLALLPFTFIVPIIAGRMSSQRKLVSITSSLFLIGTLGLLYGSSNLIALWVILLGIGGGFAFSLAMMFFSLRTENAQDAAELSGMAQSVGYLLAATGPALFGYIHDVTNSWTFPLLILVGASVLLFIFGQGAARNQSITSNK